MEPSIHPEMYGLGESFKLQSTGKHIAVVKNFEFEKDKTKQVHTELANKTGVKLASSSDYSIMDSNDKGFSIRAVEEGADGIYLEKLGVAIINSKGNDTGVNALGSEYIVEEERYVYATDAYNSQYMEGYYQATKHMYEKFEGGSNNSPLMKQTSEVNPSSDTLWALRLTKVLESKFTGKGVKIAILDTGFHLGHPDFSNRLIKHRSFIQGELVDDMHGHGTHCAGVAAGPRISQSGQRYGVACDAELFIGKVLSNSGQGTDGSLLDGIEWALEERCKIISMSLGSPAVPTETYSEAYERIFRRALMNGTLVIAAAGNESKRPHSTKRVNRPANCPSTVAVGAINRDCIIAPFSCDGELDLVAPGVQIYSSWIGPNNWNSISGTSMATPIVAGIAALIAEANSNTLTPDMPAILLKDHLLKTARQINLPPFDAGFGLVQATVPY